MLYSCTIINLQFINYFSDKHKSALIVHSPKVKGLWHSNSTVMLCSTMIPIDTEYSFTAGLRTKHKFAVPQLLSPSIGQTYPSTHQFNGHNPCLKWNRTKKHTWGRGAGEGYTVEFWNCPKNMNTKRHKKVVHNDLHTFMQESGDPQFEKPQRYLTINKSYGHVTHISVLCYE